MLLVLIGFAASVIAPKWAEPLHLRPDQMEAFTVYEMSFSKISNEIRDRVYPEIIPKIYPDRFEQVQAEIKKDLAVQEQETEAAKKFYQILDAEQRNTLNDITMPKLDKDINTPNPDEDEEVKKGANFDQPSHVAASWRSIPTANQIERVYPMGALKKKMSGQANIKCIADIYGYLANCNIISESPANLGFGNAALEITAYMRMNPAKRYGRPINDYVTVPVKFSLAK